MDGTDDTEDLNSERTALSPESSSAQLHLQILQSGVQRMATNSSSCKTWCITLVSGILILVADKSRPELAWLALIPTVLFLALDAYYLALEKAFRSSYDIAVEKLHNDQLFPQDLYPISPQGNICRHQVDAIKSFSIWGFYVALIIMAALAKIFVIQN